MEIIRIEKTKKEGKAYITDKRNLLNKSEKECFKVLSKAKSKKEWYSRINPNKENNSIEIPYKPTMRVASTINKNGTFKGLIVINIFMDDLLKSIGRSSIFKHYIIDKDNYFIHHDNEKFSFNRYKKIKRDIKSDFPDGLGGEDIFKFNLGDIIKNEDRAVFILKVDDEFEKAALNSKISTASAVLILNLILSLAIAFLLAKRPTKLQSKLLRTNEKLDKTIDELKKNELFKSSILNNTAHAIIVTDTKGDIAFFNERSRILLEYEEDEVINRSIEMFLGKSDIEKKHAQFIKSFDIDTRAPFGLLTLKTDMEMENRDEWVFVTKKGFSFTVDLFVTALKGNKGDTYSYLFMAEDISFQKILQKITGGTKAGV